MIVRRKRKQRKASRNQSWLCGEICTRFVLLVSRFQILVSLLGFVLGVRPQQHRSFVITLELRGVEGTPGGVTLRACDRRRRLSFEGKSIPAMDLLELGVRG
jgi:hypothetical protein